MTRQAEVLVGLEAAGYGPPALYPDREAYLHRARTGTTICVNRRGECEINTGGDWDPVRPEVVAGWIDTARELLCEGAATMSLSPNGVSLP